jgi:hypothetical protein
VSRRDTGEREPYIIAMAFKGCGDLEVRHTYDWETEMKQMKGRNGTDRTDQAMKIPLLGVVVL